MKQRVKHIILLIVAGWIALVSQMATAQTSSQNYIRTIEPGTASTSVPAFSTSNGDRCVIEYLDGLGRTSQSVLVGQGGANNDIVTKTEYNYLNKVAKEWLPVSGDGNGAFTTNYNHKQRAYSFYDDTYPFKRLSYQTYRDGVFQEFKPGEIWRNKTVTYSYKSISDCRMFLVGDDGSLVAKGYMPSYAVIANPVTDEDDKVVMEVRDREGRTVLRRAGDGESPHADTYFVYDIYGDLRYMISPKATAVLPLNGVCDAGVLRSMCFYYEYDVAHRVTLKRLPGAEPVYFVYDKLNRVVFSQDGVQRSSSTWSVTKYDGKQRIAVEGVATIPGATRTSLQSLWGDSLMIANPMTSPPINEMSLMYSTDCGPTGFTARKAYFYDDYSHWGNVSFPCDAGFPVNTSLSAQGMLTGTAVYDNNGFCIVEAVFYDDRGREVMRCERDYFALASSAVTFNKYSFRGLLTGRKCAATQMSEGIVTASHNVEWEYTYDNGDRVTLTKMRIDGGQWLVLDAKVYDEIGRMSRLAFGKSCDSAGDDVVDYSYNIHGNISSISSPWFSQRLYYGENPFDSSQVCYNGNLCASTSSVVNTISGLFDSQLSFSFGYDGRNQVLSAVENNAGNDIGEWFEYDLNGNITNIGRRFDGFGVQDAAVSYNGNKIVAVNDASEDEAFGLAPRFASGAYADAVGYDANGNITRDDTRAISSVSYHPFLNLPKKVSFADGSYLMWDYRPDGKKVKSTSAEKYIRVTVTVNADGDTIVRQHSRFNTDTRNYLGAFEISGSTWRVFHQAGHTDIASSGTVTNRFYLRDYLGSTAAVIDENGDVLQSTAYFPSGLPLTPNNLAPQTIRLHTGKDYFGLQDAGWYDNRARYYDCILARFTTQDPLAEKYPWLSPYNHCASNPLKFVDPDGQRISVIEKGIDYIYTYTDDGYGFYDAHGNPYQGNSEFISKLTNALSEIQRVSEGQSVVNELMTSQHSFEFRYGNDNKFDEANSILASANLSEIKATRTRNFNSNGCGGIIYWNPTLAHGGIDTNGNTIRPTYVGLAHEMFHGSDANNGIYYIVMGSCKTYTSPLTGATYNPFKDEIMKAEWRAVYRENIFRQQKNLPLRKFYGNYGPSLLDNRNNPINYPAY